MAPDTDPRQTLDVLEEDRVRLSHRVGMPTWLAPIVALFTAAWTASPVIGDQTATYVYPISVAGLVLAIYLAARTAGVRHGRMSGRAYGFLGAATAIGLVLHSTSLGLVSFDLHWWVTLPAVVAALVGYTATRLVEREILTKVTRGR